jgi:hypothetical protein
MSPKSLREQPGTAPEQQQGGCSRITVPARLCSEGAAEGRNGRNNGKRKGRAKGFVSPTRKLTDDQAAEIRYRVGGVRSMTERAAAKFYGVSAKTIRGILADKLYTKPAPKPPVTLVLEEPRALLFELVSVRPSPEIDRGRVYPFPMKRRVG